jgi:hypothetical protein
MKTQLAIETAESIVEDRKGADYYNDAAILAPYLQKKLNISEEGALELAQNINEDRKGADYYKDVKVLADYLSSYIESAEREQESVAMPGWMELYDLSIHRDVEAIAPTGYHVRGLINEDRLFEPTSGVLGEALYPPPESTVPGWVELKTLASHRDMEAVAPVEPYVHGVFDNEGRFYPDEPPVISGLGEV